MNEIHKYTVLGAGISGLALAYELLKLGPIPLIIEDSSRHTASLAAQGIVSVKGHYLPDSTLFRLKLEGHNGLVSWIDELEAKSGLVIQKNMGGCYEAFETISEFPKIAKRVFHGQYWGLTGATLLKKLPLPDGFSNLSGIYHPKDFWISVHDICRALRKILVNSGCIFLDQPIGRIDRNYSKGYFELAATSTKVKSENLFICSGANTPRNLASLGYILRLVPVFGTSISKKSDVEVSPINIIFNKCYISFLGTNFNMGGTSYVGSWGLDPQIVKNDLVKFKNLIQKLFYNKAPFDLEEFTIFQGVRIRTSNRLPLVGRLAKRGLDKRLFLLTGLHKNGIQMAYLLAKELAQDALSINNNSSWYKELSPRNKLRMADYLEP